MVSIAMRFHSHEQPLHLQCLGLKEGIAIHEQL